MNVKWLFLREEQASNTCRDLHQETKFKYERAQRLSLKAGLKFSD